MTNRMHFVQALAGLLMVALLGGCAAKKLQRRVDTQAEEIQRYESRVKDLESRNSALTARVEETASGLERSNREKSELGASVTNLTGELATVKRERDAEIVALRSKNEEEAGSAAQHATALQVRIGDLRKEIGDRDAALSKKDETIASLQGDVKSLRASNASQQDQIAMLKEDETDLREQLAAASGSRTLWTALLGTLLALFAGASAAQFWIARRKAKGDSDPLHFHLPAAKGGSGL